MNKMIIAIDPGVSGGIAFATNDMNPITADAIKMPDTPKGIYDTLMSLKEGVEDVRCICEKVGTYRPGNSAISACKFAKHTGVLEMALIALQIPSVYVSPNKWMKATFGALPKEKTPRKNEIKNRMEQQYPHLKVILATSDALGILTYGINNLS